MLQMILMLVLVVFCALFALMVRSIKQGASARAKGERERDERRLRY